MPGRLFLTLSPASIAAWFGSADAPPADPPRRNIAPGQSVLCLTAAGWGRARWGIIPVGRVNARGRPVMETIVNARSETVFDKSAYAGVGRAVIPAEGWYEWTGTTGRKTAHAIRPRGGGLLAFAAIHDVWTGPGGVQVPQVAPVTCAPSGDVVAIHDRMGVLLRPQDVPLWLTAPPDQARALLQTWPDGMLAVTPATGIDWDGA